MVKVGVAKARANPGRYKMQVRITWDRKPALRGSSGMLCELYVACGYCWGSLKRSGAPSHVLSEKENTRDGYAVDRPKRIKLQFGTRQLDLHKSFDRKFIANVQFTAARRCSQVCSQLHASCSQLLEGFSQLLASTRSCSQVCSQANL